MGKPIAWCDLLLLGGMLLGSLALTSTALAQREAQLRFQPDLESWSLHVSPRARRGEVERFVPLCQGACRVTMPTGPYVFQLRDPDGLLFTHREWLSSGPHYAIGRLESRGAGPLGILSIMLMVGGLAGGLAPLLTIGDGLDPGIAVAVSIPLFSLGILGLALTVLSFGDWQPREPILYVGRDDEED